MEPNSLPKDPAEDDWRLQATARVAEMWTSPWSGQVAAPGARLTVVSVIQLNKKKQITIPLPNATALLLNSSATAYARARVLRGSSGIDTSIQAEVAFKSDGDAIDYVERMIEAIVLAFTALEAFVNETIPADCIYSYSVKGIAPQDLNKAEIERQVSIDEKLSSVLPSALKCASPKQSQCWSDFKQLKAIRNRLIHMKSADRRSSTAEVETLWKLLFSTATPHFTVKAVIDHFVKSMDAKPGWHVGYPFGRKRK
jgi:hypothetical protein